MVGILIRSLTKGGAEKQALLLAKILTNKYNTLMIVLYGEKLNPIYRKFIETERIECIILEGSLLDKVIRLWRLLREKNISVLFTYLATDNLIGAVVGKLAGVKIIVGGIRNAFIPFLKLWTCNFLHYFLQSYTIFNNYSGRDEFVKRYLYSTRKSLVFSNCIENIPAILHRNTNNSAISILSVGRLVDQKDYETGLQAISLLKKMVPSVSIKYVIIGYGILESKLRELIRALELEANVELVPDSDNLDPYYRSADIFLITSLFEGLSNSVMEAMSYSLPVVATNVGDNNRLVTNDFNGFLVDKKDITAVTNALRLLTSSLELRVQMGKRSYDRLVDDYTIEKFKLNYYSFIDSIYSE